MTAGFKYENGELTCEGISIREIAEKHGTPLYVYSGGQFRANYQRIAKAFSTADVMVAYSVKSNSNLAVLQLLRNEGAAFDIVSGGELERVRKVGVPGERIIFAGVGKREDEMRLGLKHGVAEFNLESEMEAERLNEVAGAMKRKAPVAIRVNPDVDPGTHAKITTGKKENKFGVSMERALALAVHIAKDLGNLELMGLHTHIGSQILDPAAYVRTVGIITDFARRVMSESGVKLRTLNMGGGFGIAYRPGQKPMDLKPYAQVLIPEAKKLGVKLILEPGRSISASAGSLITRVEYIKPGEKKTFVIIDGSMTDLMRPTLYEAYHEIQPVVKKRGKKAQVDFVGPVCETGDYLALDRESIVPEQGDLLAVMDTGAYGFAMASNYNTRGRAAEVLVLDGQAHEVRARETVKDCMRGEKVV